MATNTTIRPKGYMTPNEVGQLLGVTGDCIKGRIRAGKLKARRTPNGFYWVRMDEAIRTFAESGAKGKSPLVRVEDVDGYTCRVMECGNGRNGKR